MTKEIRCGVHASDCEVVEVVVSQDYSADQDSDDTAHLKELSHHVAHNAKDVGKGHLSDLVLHQEPEPFE